MATYYNNVSNPTDQARGMAAEQGRPSRPTSIYADMFSNTGSTTTGPWTPLTVRGISNYPPEFELSPELFMVKYQEVITEYSTSTSEEKKELLRQFFLHSALPHMEEKLEGNDSPSLFMLKILPHLCCVNDSLVNRYALNLALNVLSKRSCDADERMQNFIIEMEDKIREGIIGEAFVAQPPEDQGLRTFVYSRVLMMLIVLIERGKPRAAIGNKLERISLLHEKLYSFKFKTPFKERKTPRYAVACIYEAIQVLRSPKKERRFCDFLDWLQMYHQNEREIKEREKFVKDFVYKISWFDLHIVISYLEPRIHEQPKTMEILQLLVHQYINARKSLNPMVRLRWSEEELHWQTGLQFGRVLENIAMKNKDDAIRKLACGSLCLYVNALRKDNKISQEKLFLEQNLERCCFGPSKTFLPMMLSQLQNDKSITVLLSMNYLESSRYKQQMVPHSHQFRYKDPQKGLFKAHFRGEASMVKVLEITPDDQRGVQTAPSKSYQDLTKEAYFLRRLNVTPHPNIVRVFAFDTYARPYHIITEYADKGTLLQYLQDARSDIPPLPKPSMLIHMMLGVIDGLMYLNERQIVHQSIMSSNILVSNDRICKLTGFKALQEMMFNNETNAYEYISKKDETSIRHAAPEILTDGHYSEKSMVFHCAYILFEMYTYGKTPYNWLKDSEAEKIRSLVLSERSLPEERCIPPVISEIMKGCLSFNVNERPNLAALKNKLTQVQSTLLTSADADRPSTDYLPLTYQDKLQTNPSSCYSMDKKEHSRVLGIFGSQTLAQDRAEIQNIRGIPQIREQVEKTKEEDLQKLKQLHNQHIVRVLAITDFSARYNALYTEYSERGNLLHLVLARNCNSNDLVRFLVQILSGMIFLHDSNILHCDIRAENMMFFYDEFQGLQVKIARLGRSLYLRTSPMECEMPKDAIRRSPPEVIKNNTYSISSDVWSFALMCYEIYDAYGRNQECQPTDVEPIKCKEEDVLAYLEGNNRPKKPQCMPDWLHITVKQGLLQNPEERPPPILLNDCFTYLKPFESCLLTRWKEYHPDQIASAKIDLNVKQPFQDHIIPPEDHIPFDDLKQMSPVAVFLQHSYKYTPGNELPVNEDLYEPIRIVSNNLVPRNSGESRVEDVVYDELNREPFLAQPGSSRTGNALSRRLPPPPPHLDLNPDNRNRCPAPLPRQPLPPAPNQNSIGQPPTSDEVLYENYPIEHNEPSEMSWHSLLSTNSR